MFTVYLEPRQSATGQWMFTAVGSEVRGNPRPAGGPAPRLPHLIVCSHCERFRISAEGWGKAAPARAWSHAQRCKARELDEIFQPYFGPLLWLLWLASVLPMLAPNLPWHENITRELEDCRRERNR